MNGLDLIEIVITAAVTGVFSAVGTVAALRVHIIYLREAVGENKKAIERAHRRLDEWKSV